MKSMNKSQIALNGIKGIVILLSFWGGIKINMITIELILIIAGIMVGTGLGGGTFAFFGRKKRKAIAVAMMFLHIAENPPLTLIEVNEKVLQMVSYCHAIGHDMSETKIRKIIIALSNLDLIGASGRSSRSNV